MKLAYEDNVVYEY